MSDETLLSVLDSLLFLIRGRSFMLLLEQVID